MDTTREPLAPQKREAYPGSRLSPEDRQTLLQVARRSLVDYFANGRLAHYPTDRPALRTPRATFVTLRQRATFELRGCRGEISARYPLIESVARNAVASAIDDMRFEPVTGREVPGLHIEISALTPMHRITPQEVVVGVHGLVIRAGYATGLLLPQVPGEYGWDRAAFLRGVCRKAGLREDAWQSPGVELEAFEAEVWGED